MAKGKGIIDSPAKDESSAPASKVNTTSGKKGIIASPIFVGEKGKGK